MVCEHCGKELTKVGVLTDEEKEEFYFVNEKNACAYQAIDSSIVKDIEFTDGQIFEYFRAAYDALAQARFLRHIFEKKVKTRLNVDINKNIFIADVSLEVYVHPDENNE